MLDEYDHDFPLEVIRGQSADSGCQPNPTTTNTSY